MSQALPHPKLPPGSELKVYALGYYKWRASEEPWTYCIGKKKYVPLCQEYQPGQLLVHPLKSQRPRMLNPIFKGLGFRGEFHQIRGRILFTQRWPYPDTLYFPGMIVDRKARVLNGTWEEQEDRKKFSSWLRLYSHVLRSYLKYRPTYPLPEEGVCLHCDGAKTAYRTMYYSRNHLRRHLRQCELPGALLWNALEAAGYADKGKLDILGYGQGPAQPNILIQTVIRYFKIQGGF